MGLFHGWELAGTVFHNQENSRLYNAETDQGRGIAGVIGGVKSKGVEDESRSLWRNRLSASGGYCGA